MTNPHFKSNSKKEKINIYNSRQFLLMEKAGNLAARTLDYITQFVKPEITTQKLNELCHNFIIKNKNISRTIYFA